MPDPTLHTRMVTLLSLLSSIQRELYEILVLMKTDEQEVSST